MMIHKSLLETQDRHVCGLITGSSWPKLWDVVLLPPLGRQVQRLIYTIVTRKKIKCTLGNPGVPAHAHKRSQEASGLRLCKGHHLNKRVAYVTEEQVVSLVGRTPISD
jgi:hypothetical protein